MDYDYFFQVTYTKNTKSILSKMIYVKNFRFYLILLFFTKTVLGIYCFNSSKIQTRFNFLSKSALKVEN